MFFLDYHQLKKITIKDKNPIPIFDELFNELSVSTFFTKIILQASFNQIRVADLDIHKIAFSNNHDHFEFLVMLFVLINTTALFQSQMNYLFYDHLCNLSSLTISSYIALPWMTIGSTWRSPSPCFAKTLHIPSSPNVNPPYYRLNI